MVGPGDCFSFFSFFFSFIRREAGPGSHWARHGWSHCLDRCTSPFHCGEKKEKKALNILLLRKIKKMVCTLLLRWTPHSQKYSVWWLYIGNVQGRWLLRMRVRWTVPCVANVLRMCCWCVANVCQVDADQIALCSGGAVVDKGRHEALIRSQKVNFTLYSGFHVYIRSCVANVLLMCC